MAEGCDLQLCARLKVRCFVIKDVRKETVHSCRHTYSAASTSIGDVFGHYKCDAYVVISYMLMIYVRQVAIDREFLQNNILHVLSHGVSVSTPHIFDTLWRPSRVE